MYKLIATGLDDIDSQHQQLVNCMNELHTAILAKVTKAALESATQKLSYYALSHLTYEEKTMNFYKFPQVESHVQQHQFFIHKLEEIADKVKSDAPLVATDLLVFLREWLLNHIGQEDVRFAAFLKEDGLQKRD